MAMFKTWCPERGETAEDAREVEAYDLRIAAELDAEEYLWDSADPFTQITIRVASTTADREWDVEVTVHAAPVFSAVSDVEIEMEDDDGLPG